MKTILLTFLTIALISGCSEKPEHTKIVFNTEPADYDTFEPKKWAINDTLCLKLKIHEAYSHEYWRPTINTNYYSATEVAAIKFTNATPGSEDYLIQFIEGPVGPEKPETVRANKVLFSGFKVGQEILIGSKFKNGVLEIKVNGKTTSQPISFTPTGLLFSSSTSYSSLEYADESKCN